MNQLPTAEEFLKENANDISYEEGQMFAADVTPDMLIQFTKLHVQAALQAAAENAECKFIDYDEAVVRKDSIINSYPEENIK